MNSIPLSLHSTNIGRANLNTLFKAAKSAGFDYVEPTKVQLQYFLDAGHTPGEIKELADGMKISAVGWIADCERQGYEYTVMMKEAEKLFSLASEIGAEAVEVLNGPVDYHAVESFRNGTGYSGYMGLQGLPIPEQERLTAKNLGALADLAAQFGLKIYFEALCWTPISSPVQSVAICRRAERDNLKIVFDFFHAYISGVTAEFITSIDPRLILGVHVCDSLRSNGGVPVEPVLRDVELGKGFVPLNEWIGAVKSTGFSGWWAYESFSKREAEEDPLKMAKAIHQQLTELIGGVNG